MHSKANSIKGTDQYTSYLRSSINPRTVILGLAIVYFIVMAMRVARWYQEFGRGRISVSPDWLLVVPFWLILAALVLLIRKWWGELLAILISGRVLYVLVYLAFRGIGFARDVPSPFSLASLRIWLIQTYAAQPQEFLEIALAFVIACYAILALSRRWLRRNARAETLS